MALTVNTNLNAYTALNALEGNQSGLNTATQRLSTGLQINSAADDPAGEIISQKYLAQVNGLGQAITNAQDGVNLVQTTEGALTQVSSILQNMRTLALNAANTGANDSSATAADQQQVTAALQQINMIAQQTQFGSKVLLNGSSGTTGQTSSTQVNFIGGSSNTVSGTYKLNVTQAATQGQVVSQATSAAGGTGNTVTITNSGNTAAAAAMTQSSSIAFDINGTTRTAYLSVAQGATAATVVAAVNAQVGKYGIVASATGGGFNVSFVSTQAGANGSQTFTATTGGAGAAALTTLMGAGTTATAHAAQAIPAYLTTQNITGTGLTTAGTVGTSDESLVFSGNAVNGGNPLTVAIAQGSAISDIVNQVNQNAGAQAAGITASLDTTGTHIVLTSSHVAGGTAAAADFQVAVNNGSEGVAASQLGTIAGLGGQTLTATAATGTAAMNAETLTFGNGANTVNVGIANGTTIAAGVAQINQALTNAGINMTAAFNSTTSQFTLTNNAYGSNSTVANTFSSNLTGTASTELATASGTTYSVADSSLVGSTTGQDVAGTFMDSSGNQYAATGAGQFLTGTANTAVDNLQVAVTSSTAQIYQAESLMAAGSTNDLGTVTVANNSLQFQVGAYADQTVGLDIGSMSTSMLGTTATGTTTMTNGVNLSNINVATSANSAQDAIKVIDAAIAQVSSLSASLGSFQDDVLQSSVDNLTTAQQNIRASYSGITDTNFAQEMLTYSQGQILNQTSMSMLTQANQNAQQVLKLFQ